MEADFCIEAVEDALARYGKPEIFNTDQGSQFTSIDFTAVLKKAGDRHLDGWQGRVARQRLRRAALAVDQIRRGLSPRLQDRIEARAGIGRYLAFYNSRRPHSSLLTGRRRIRPTSTRWHQ